ncbi:MAG: 2,3-bisphosphoglycerate-independent phosphoglycerate mutase [bacterium]|nr:2,3-bisphosphoglycerate-independent phosphoglycerate mutase [bacterium]
MLRQNILQSLVTQTESKIILLVVDGIGGIPIVDGKTEVEAAYTPNLDKLAKESVCGVADPIAPGITPGSGPAHLSLFGYDPITYQIGRGVLSALGIGFELMDGDVATRGNFCSLDAEGIITDRRAGRIPTETCATLCRKIQTAIPEIDGVQIFVLPEMEYRFVVIFRGKGLSGEIADTDPQNIGVKPKPAVASAPEAERTATMVNQFIHYATEILKNEHPANGILLRGFASKPQIPSMSELYQLNAAAIATYPMYRGLAKLVGMTVIPTGETMQDELKTLQENYSRYNFFYFHVKKTDSYGEDGNYTNKIKVIEDMDKYLIPEIVALRPDVLAITGDHSTPASLKSHSWHPVPFLLHAKTARIDRVQSFSEIEFSTLGGLGRINSMEVMPLLLAHALKLKKFGA